MMTMLIALLAGLVFGLGLTFSKMIDPAKVLGFLDPLGTWDPSLALVMAAAVPVAAIGFRLSQRRSSPLWAKTFSLPRAHAVDRPLIVGAALFGIGWGLAGYCPGPALAALSIGGPHAVETVLAMIAGMVVFQWCRR